MGSRVDVPMLNYAGLQDKLPLLQNLAAFLVAAGVFRLSPLFKPGAVDLDLISKEGQKKQDAKDMRDE